MLMCFEHAVKWFRWDVSQISAKKQFFTFVVLYFLGFLFTPCLLCTDPTAGPSASDQSTWYLDESTLSDNIKKTLHKFCGPSPVVFR